MPFTVSHAAAVLPFFSKKVSRSAIVIGSMIPDLPLFLAAGRYDVSHSFAGIFFYNLPVGFVAWLIWTHIMRGPTRDLCPEPLRASLFEYGERYTSKPVLMLSLILGAATHVFWDGFTHLNAFGPELFPSLLVTVGNIAIYRWLQIICSVLGLLLLGRWLARQWDREIDFPKGEVIRFLYTWTAVLISCIGFAAFSERNNIGRHFYYGTIILSMQLFFCSWFLYCIVSLVLGATNVKIASGSKEPG